jgi:hypothetical protein
LPDRELILSGLRLAAGELARAATAAVPEKANAPTV